MLFLSLFTGKYETNVCNESETTLRPFDVKI